MATGQNKKAVILLATSLGRERKKLANQRRCLVATCKKQGKQDGSHWDSESVPPSG